MASPGMQQTQNLSMQQVLAPQLQQSLVILQAPMLELRNIVQQELQTNPVLEEEVPESSSDERDSSKDNDDFKEEFDHLAKLDEEWREYMSQSSSYSGRNDDEEERRQFFFDSIANQETLQQHLMGQLNSVDLSKTDQRLAELIIHRRQRLPANDAGGDERQHRRARGRFDAVAGSGSNLPPGRRRSARFTRLFADPTAQARQGKHAGVPDHLQAPG